MKMRDKNDNSKFYKALSYVAEIAADILWPKKCIVCRCLVPIGQKHAICSDCAKLAKKQSTIFIEPDRYFDEAVASLPYADNVRMSMIRYKFSAHQNLKYAFSYALARSVEDRDFMSQYDIICPVPIHPMRDREYNQSLLIAKEISNEFGLQFCPDLLIKTKNLTPLSTMGYAMRRVCVVGAVDFNLKYDIFGKNILLLDDIYTTGSTADECSKILKMHGASNVIVLAACYAEWKGDEYNADADYLSY